MVHALEALYIIHVVISVDYLIELCMWKNKKIHDSCTGDCTDMLNIVNVNGNAA